MKTYLFSTRPKLPTQSSSRNRLRPFFMVLFLFSIVAILTVNSCTTDFNAAQTNKQTNILMLPPSQRQETHPAALRGRRRMGVKTP